MPDIIPQRTCTKCNEAFPVTTDYWYKCSRSKDGFIRICKKCKTANKRQWEQDNRDHVNAWKREHRKLEHVQDADRDYRKRTNEHRTAYNREYRRNHPEWTKAANKRHHDKYREKRNAAAVIRVKIWHKNNPGRAAMTRRAYYALNREAILRYQREYEKRNPAIAARHNAVRNHNRRARLLAADGTFTAADIRLQYRSQRGLCWHCGKSVGEDYHVDHLRPLAKDGSNDPRNLVISCAPCNLSKGDKQTWEWNGRLF